MSTTHVIAVSLLALSLLCIICLVAVVLRARRGRARLQDADRDSKWTADGFHRTRKMLTGRGWPVIIHLYPVGFRRQETKSRPVAKERGIDSSLMFVSDLMDAPTDDRMAHQIRQPHSTVVKSGNDSV